MANLITTKQKKGIRLDYFIRLCALSLLVLSLLGSFLLAYVVPYYFSVSEKDNQAAESFKNAINVENKENVGESATQVVAETLDELKVEELYNGSQVTPSTYFSKVIENKNSSIRLTNYSFSLQKAGVALIVVGGVSKNREGLVTFIEDLRSKAGFASVDYPVSDYANDRDIPFTLNIKTTL